MIVSSDRVREVLDVPAMLAEARAEAGLDDFGDPRFIDALDAMCRHFAMDIQVHEQGLANTRETIVRQLVNRARFAADLAAHPEILDEDVSDPIIILGLPRSGTTKTHRMMGVDPNLLATRMWQLVNPAPFPDAPEGGPDPRIAAAIEGDKLIEASNTRQALRAGHLYGSEEVQEDLWLFGFTFNDNFYSCMRPASRAYMDYTSTRTDPSQLDNYHYVRDLLRYLQWQQGGRQGRRWLHKHVGNIGYLDELSQTYPRATLVHIHRTPMKSIASLCKLWMEWYRVDSGEVDPIWAGEWALHVFGRLMDRYLEARDRLGLDIYDVPYETVRSDPMPAFREIYRRAGHELTPESEALMLEYERRNEQGKHGAHVYDLSDFGLSEAKIRERFGAYMDRFIESP